MPTEIEKKPFSLPIDTVKSYSKGVYPDIMKNKNLLQFEPLGFKYMISHIKMQPHKMTKM